MANYVRGAAINLEEAQVERQTGVTDTERMRARPDRVLATGRLPMSARFIAAEDPDSGLQRILDGFEKRLSAPPEREAPAGR